MRTLFVAGVRCLLDCFKDPIDSWLPESLDACSCEKRNWCMGSGALLNSSDCVRAGSSDCVTAGSSDCVTAGSSDCVTAGSSDCNVNESSRVFKTRTAARWSFLQSLQIPVNSQTLNTTHTKFEKCTVIDTFSWISFRSNNVHLPSQEKMSPCAIKTTALTYDDDTFLCICVTLWVPMVLVRDRLVRCPLPGFS